MSKPVRAIVATVVLGGVAVVWVPRLTGWDPLGLFASASAPDASGSATLDVTYDLPSMHAPGELPPGDPGDPTMAPTTGESENALSALGSVLSYLEERETRRDLSENTAVAARAVAQEHQALAGAVGRLDAPASLAEFLERHPLSAIAVGDTRSCALFGRINVAPGDELLDGDVVVHAVERDGVVLDTRSGRVRIPLPPPGELRQLYRSQQQATQSADQERDTSRPKQAGDGARAPIKAGQVPATTTDDASDDD